MDVDEGGGILGEAEDQVTCWVCFEIFSDPVTLSCGHSFCRDCCLKMYKKMPLCAFCRREFGLPLAATNQELLRLAEAFKRGESGMPESFTPEFDQDSIWVILPDEVAIDIMGFLRARDLGRLSCVCHQFHSLADDSFLWRSLCRETFPFVSVANYGNDWKKCYIMRSRTQRGWETGKPGDFKMQVLREHTNYIACFDYYRNNVVSGSGDHGIKVWSCNRLKPLRTLGGHAGPVTAVKFNEIRVASGSADTNSRIWDTETGLCSHILPQGSPVQCLDFSENQLVTTGTGDAKVWDIRTGRPQHTLSGHAGPIHSLDYTGNRVITADSQSVRLWDIRTGACLTNLAGGAPPTKIVCSGNRDLFVGGADGALRHWDLAAGTIVHSFPARGGPFSALATDGTHVLAAHVGTPQIQVYDVKRKQALQDLTDHTAPVNDIQFDGQRVVSASADNTIKVWDLNGKKRLYSLLGGSLQQRGNNPPHPTRPGCSMVKFDEGRIVGAFNSLLRVYSFTGEAVEKTF